MGPTIAVVATNILALSSALVVGFAVGRFAGGGGKKETQQHPSSVRGAKRRARIKKSEDNSRARAAGLASPPSEEEKRSKQVLSSRRARSRKKKLAPRCVALDAWTRVARSYIKSIGEGDYESLLLLPRACFIVAGRFVPYAECRDQLVSLGQARAATAGVEQLRVLYVSCSWASAGGGEGTGWAVQDFETTRAYLQRNPDLSFVYVGRSCVAGSSSSTGHVRSTQLRHVAPALLRSDAVLVLPRLAESPGGEEGSGSMGTRYTDFECSVRGSRSRMVLAIAAVGQAKVSVAFRAGSYPESVVELELGKSNVRATAKQAADALRAAAAKRPQKSAAAVVKEACGNWLGTDLNPLSALEQARAVVEKAQKSDDGEALENIQSMRPAPSFAASARTALGDEYVEGERELALSMLLFAVLCSQPKERATYTDSFVEDVGKMEISYRPVAVVRSPYRERFGTPRQPQVTASVLHGGAQEGQIVFLRGRGYEEALEDLSGFDMIWILTHMHLNKGWNPKVRPPRLPEERKGLFSTRSPHRPNAIALSSLRVGRVDAASGVIYVHGLDLLDGTPVLDIKPYIGYCDAFPNMKAGWLDALGSDHEGQGDFLPKFSVGATLVHTDAGSQRSPTRTASRKPNAADQAEAS
ncbi:unnamed protein product [Ectocarpus sp. 4 AP-2014]